MSESTSTVESLRVVIDANTAQFKAGIEQAQGIIQKFAGDGTGMLGKFDGALAAVGNRAIWLRGTFGLWLTMIETGMGLVDKFFKQGEQIAAATGQAEAFGQLKSAIEGLTTAARATLFQEARVAGREYEEVLTDVARAARAAATEVAGVQQVASTPTLSIGEALGAKGPSRPVDPDTPRIFRDMAVSAEAVAAAGDLATRSMQQWGHASLDLALAHTQAEAALQRFIEQSAKYRGDGWSGPVVTWLNEMRGAVEFLRKPDDRTNEGLEGQIRSMSRAVLELQRQLETFRKAGDLPTLFGTSEDAEREMAARIAGLKEKIAELKRIRDEERTGDTDGFDTKVVAALDKEIAALEQKARTFGMAAEEAAALVLEERLLAAISADRDGLYRNEKKALDERIARLKELKLAEAFHAQIENGEREIAMIEKRTEALGREAGAAARLMAEHRILAALRKEFSDLNDDQQAKLTAYLDKLKEVTETLKAAESAKKVSTSIEGLEAEIRAIEHRTEQIGKAGGAAARAAADFKIMAEAMRLGVTITPEMRTRLDELLDKLEAAAGAQKSAQDAEAIKKQIQGIVDQSAALRGQIDVLDASAGAQARAAAAQRVAAAAAAQGRTLSESETRALAAATAELEKWTDAKKRAEDVRRFDKDLAGAEREIEAIQRRSRALLMEAEAVARVEMTEKLLQVARQNNITLDADRLARIDEIATAYGRATEAAKALEHQMAMIKESGAIVTRSLMQVFDQWMSGTEIKGREMVASLLREFAKLTLMKSVLGPGQDFLSRLLGGMFGGGGGAGYVGNFGGWDVSAMLPARASGGPVVAGQPYMVGELGPEPFIPAVDGFILPNSALRGGSDRGSGAAPLTLNIDARGATPDAVKMLEARLPGLVLQTVSDARERGMM